MARNNEAHERGDRNEKRVLALLLAHRPVWVLGAEQTVPHSLLDQRGTDIVVTTDRGPLAIQVKSSVVAGCRFRKAARDRGELDQLAVVVVASGGGVELAEEALLERLLAEVERVYWEKPAKEAHHGTPLTSRPFAALVSQLSR